MPYAECLGLCKTYLLVVQLFLVRCEGHNSTSGDSMSVDGFKPRCQDAFVFDESAMSVV